MGEVYRGRDPRLGRDVAIKVLPSNASADPGRLHRFEQEARAAAALNHPNILAVYDVGVHDGAPYIVSELLDGKTLRERLNDGSIMVRTAIDYAVQMAHGLAAAHEKGIVHRDLKPDNVLVTSDGRVKILDFGLAKLIDQESTGAISSVLPTSPPGTSPGLVLGTTGYMSPEQVRGALIDRRTDIFALGVVLYEMLTGRRAFIRETVPETMTAILREDVPDLHSGNPQVPLPLEQVLRRCLDKDPARRFQSTQDLAFALSTAGSATTSSVAVMPAVGPPMASHRGYLALVAVLGLALIALSVVHFREPTAVRMPLPMARVAITLPPGNEMAHRFWPALALSSDGSKLAYTALQGTAAPQLFLRVMDGTTAKAIAGTEGAHSPFFSPDGQWIGFFAQGKLKKVPADGGAAQVLCDAPGGMGGDWAADDTIYFVPSNTDGVWKVSASGGTPEEVTKVDRTKGEVSHRWPQALPGGKAVVFTVWVGPGWDEKSLQLHVLGTGERRVLAQGASGGRYVASGHMVYNRDGAQNLVALPFDLARLQVAGGPAVTLVEQIWEGGAEGAQFAVSDAGTMAYVSSHPHRYERRLAWIDRQGKVEPLSAPPRPYYDPRISPDGQQVAVSSEEATERVWTYNFVRATLTPLTAASVSSQAPAWMPDGTRVVYRGSREGFRNLFWTAANGSDQEERLTTSENLQTPVSVSPDGKRVAYTDIDRVTGNDIWVVSLDGNRAAQPFLKTQASESNAHFSPDGHWLAYSSDESGRVEIYVQPFPGPGGKWTISTDGGTEPLWSHDGRELFYRNGDAVMAVSVAYQPTFSAGLPHRLFSTQFEPTGAGTSGYDVSPDGRRFLMIQPNEPEQPATQVSIVINWFEELRRLVPSQR
jgi:serine/threonine-protein kinase